MIINLIIAVRIGVSVRKDTDTRVSEEVWERCMVQQQIQRFRGTFANGSIHLTISEGVLHMDQKGVADRFGGFFTWNKKA